MHKLASTSITLDRFEMDDYSELEWYDPEGIMIDYNVSYIWDIIIDACESLRKKYNETKDQRYWKELIRILPEGWLQTRTVNLNYEVLRTMYYWRKDHKLSEWREFCAFIAENLPYAGLLITDEEDV